VIGRRKAKRRSRWDSVPLKSTEQKGETAPGRKSLPLISTEVKGDARDSLAVLDVRAIISS